MVFRLWASLAIVVLLSIAAYLFLGRRNGPDGVAFRAADALCRVNARALLSLASDEEKRKLNLNEENVTGFLAETYLGKSDHQLIRIDRQNEIPIDQFEYRVSMTNFAGRLHASLEVEDSPTVGWKLSLALTLRFAATVTADTVDLVEANNFAEALLRKHGIRGVKSNTGGYAYLAGTDPANAAPQ